MRKMNLLSSTTTGSFILYQKYITDICNCNRICLPNNIKSGNHCNNTPTSNLINHLPLFNITAAAAGELSAVIE